MRRFWKPTPKDEVDDELSFHIEMRTRELIAAGLDPDTARRQAAARFGDVEAVRDTCRTIADRRDRDVRRTEYIAELRDDARFALRQLARNPGFTIVAVVTLALGIGATTAIFSAVRAVVLRPFAWDDPERLMLVGERWGPHLVAEVSAGNYVDWREQSRSFEHLSATQFASFTLNGGDAPERVTGAYATWSYFPTFGARPAFGRTFSEEEDQPGRDDVAVLSHGLWRGRFGADSAVLGRVIEIDGRQRTIIGVMEPGFDPALVGEQLWVPIAFTPERRAMHDEHYLNVYGRIREGLTYEQVQRELDRIALVQQERFPLVNEGRGIGMQRLDRFLVDDYRIRLWVMLGAVSLVLLIACGNVANLLLARGAARAREMAIRTAIGAGRGRLVRQLVTESFVLSLLGTGVGLIIAWLLIDVLVASAPPDIPRIAGTRIDGWVFLFALGASVASALVFGLVPSLRAGRADVQPVLKTGGHGVVGAGRDFLRSGLIIAEVALSLTLLMGAGLLIRSALWLQRVEPGFEPSGLLAARIGLPPRGYRQGAEELAHTFEQIVETVRRQPGVASASLTSQAPLGPGSTSNGLIPEGRPIAVENVIQARLRMVTPGYFETMGIPLVSGRDFTAADLRSSQLVMIVSEALADAAWPNEDPIGKRITCCEGSPEDPKWKTVIGVARDVRSLGPTEDARPEFYVPMRQVPPEAWSWIDYAMTIVVRARTEDAGAAAALTPALRSSVRAIAPTVPVYGVSVAEHALRESMAPQRFNSLLLGSLGAIGLLLAAAGIYGVIAYFVSMRTREIGIRIALGASARDVLRLLTWEGVRPVLAGVALGALAAFWATRLLQGSLYGVEPDDPATFGIVAALLVTVALLATLVPARRATRVQPTTALGGG